MKKNWLPLLVSCLVIFLVGFLLKIQLDQINSKNDFLALEKISQTKTKKISYGDGEYEKVLKTWMKKLNESFLTTSENMLIQQEKLVILNFKDLSNIYQSLFQEMLGIEPTKKYSNWHKNFMEEALLGKKLCDSYMQKMSHYDEYFRKYYLIHYKNTKFKKD